MLRILEAALIDAKHDVAPWIERLARVGYVAKALLYGTVGVLAAGAAIGHGRSTDSRGAMLTLIEAPFGRFLLAAMAAGLFGYALWRCVSAVVDAEGRGNDAKGLGLRASFLVRGAAHFLLGLSAARVAMGRTMDGGGQSEAATGAAMRMPGGVWIIWATAITVAGFGLYQLYRAAAAKLSKQLDLRTMRVESVRWVIAVSRFGIAARGLVFIAIAWLLGKAAAAHDAAEAGGIGDALKSLASLGRFPYAAIGAGLFAYGLYELLNARYRRVEAA